MIIYTQRALDIARWIDDNCEQSSYELEEGSFAPLLRPNVSGCRADRAVPMRITLTIHPDDQVMFDLRFHGWFVRHPVHDRWYDDTQLNRFILLAYNDDA
jgi:hypothetical protein